MKSRSLFRKFLFYISVPKCISCNKSLNIDERVFCKKCMEAFYEGINRDCSICKKRLTECSCTPQYLNNHFVKKLSKVFRYVGKNENKELSSLIYSLKKQAGYDTVEFAAELMKNAVTSSQNLTEDTIITNVPRRRSAILKYGHDHSAVIAKRLAEKLGLKYQALLKSGAKIEQKHLTKEERLKNTSIKPRANYDLSGKSLLIVDDIVTTGASMSACASVLRGLGCKNISAVTLAIAYRDNM